MTSDDQKKTAAKLLGKHPTCAETCRINQESGDVLKRLHRTKERFAHLTEAEMNQSFGLCQGTTLDGVHTTCRLGNEGKPQTLTRLTASISDRPHCCTGRCNNCNTIETRNRRTERQQYYYTTCINAAAQTHHEDVMSVRVAFNRVVQAGGFELVCQICHQDVVWLESKMNAASMNRRVQLNTYHKDGQQLEVTCLCCNLAYQGFWGVVPRQIHMKIGVYIKAGEFDPTGDVRLQLKKIGEEEGRMIVDMESHISNCVCAARFRAKHDKLPFNLTNEYMAGLIKDQHFGCSLSAIMGVMAFNEWNSFGIDKIVPGTKIGYVKGNVQWVLNRLNFGKSDHNDADYRKYLKKQHS